MAMGAIELTTITRAQDYSYIKQNEDNKGLVNQVNSYQQVQKNESQKTREVHKSDDTRWNNQNPDAREKGKGQYSSDGGRKRKKETFEKVIPQNGDGFDIKI